MEAGEEEQRGGHNHRGSRLSDGGRCDGRGERERERGQRPSTCRGSQSTHPQWIAKLRPAQRVGLPGDHRELLESPATFELIKSFLKDVAKPKASRDACEGGAADKLPAEPVAGASSHFYASYKYWQYCSETFDLPEDADGWLLV